MRVWGELWLQYGDSLPEHVKIHPRAVSRFFEGFTRAGAIKLLELHIEELKEELAYLQALAEEGYEWPLRDMKETLADLKRAERILAQLKGYSVRKVEVVVNEGG
ncbi:hypothetical protein [Thermococcus barophilus]|uniref:Uncharacterized protein n=1 Tax=Thermococcus barophilus TaxID=55802 RepID=A0A0S1XAQ4_THEBA|nr:hypothetical protein [Thermococcus barophilus]ALM74865.1 hypothetical protein TBCH5v1_0915 [Thermococcus barophilus]